MRRELGKFLKYAATFLIAGPSILADYNRGWETLVFGMVIGGPVLALGYALDWWKDNSEQKERDREAAAIMNKLRKP